MAPQTYNACLRHWRIEHGLEAPGPIDPAAQQRADQHNLLAFLRTRFGSRPA